MPIQRTLIDMEIAGFPVDRQKLSKINSNLSEELKNLEKKIFKMHGRHFNISSPNEVAKVKLI